MNKFFVWVVVLVLGALMLGAVLPTSAQEVTPEAGETVTVSAESWWSLANTNLAAQALLTVIVALSAGGGLALVFRHFTKADKDTQERLYLALPPVWQTTIQRGLEIGQTAAQLLNSGVAYGRQITDGQPNTDGTVLSYNFSVPDDIDVTDADMQEMQRLIQDFWARKARDRTIG